MELKHCYSVNICYCKKWIIRQWFSTFFACDLLIWRNISMQPVIKSCMSLSLRVFFLSQTVFIFSDDFSEAWEDKTTVFQSEVWRINRSCLKLSSLHLKAAQAIHSTWWYCSSLKRKFHSLLTSDLYTLVSETEFRKHRNTVAHVRKAPLNVCCEVLPKEYLKRLPVGNVF